MAPELADAGTVTEVAQPEATPVLPVMAHAERYSAKGRQDAAVAEANAATQEETPEQRAVTAQQKRDKETGQFEKSRHRAASQKATPEDGPRINQLTARAKTAEERATAAETELARLRSERAPAAQIARAEEKVETTAAAASTFREAEPQENDAAFAGDYGKYLRAAAAWEGRKAYHDERTRERVEQEQQTKQQAQRDAVKSWSGRVDAAKEKYADFEQVAFTAPAPWLNPDGTAQANARTLDAWIMEHKTGPDVLYYFQSEKNRQELGSLLAKPVLEQVEHLALLSQRLLPESATPDGVTRSSAGRNTKITLPPRPPNLVRTEAQRSGNVPPPTDGSLSVSEHAKRWRAR